jgi:hypothetical protein
MTLPNKPMFDFRWTTVDVKTISIKLNHTYTICDEPLIAIESSIDSLDDFMVCTWKDGTIKKRKINYNLLRGKE